MRHRVSRTFSSELAHAAYYKMAYSLGGSTTEISIGFLPDTNQFFLEGDIALRSVMPKTVVARRRKIGQLLRYFVSLSHFRSTLRAILRTQATYNVLIPKNLNDQSFAAFGACFDLIVEHKRMLNIH